MHFECQNHFSRFLALQSWLRCTALYTGINRVTSCDSCSAYLSSLPISSSASSSVMNAASWKDAGHTPLSVPQLSLSTTLPSLGNTVFTRKLQHSPPRLPFLRFCLPASTGGVESCRRAYGCGADAARNAPRHCCLAPGGDNWRSH